MQWVKKLLKLDEHQITMALGMAGSMAGGLIHNFGTMTKPLHAGLVCRDGIMAAQLAQRGLTAGERIIAHPLGFANTVLGQGIYDLDEMAENLGKPFRIQDALIIKKYPCCGGNHSMLDSLFSLMREHNFTYEDVASAEVDQPYLSIVTMYGEPEDDLQGKFSSRYNVAAALVDNKVDIGTFSRDKIADPNILETMKKVSNRVVSKAEEGAVDFSKGIPIRITLKDGRVFEHTTTRGDILGSQGNPWGFENIKSKFQVNAGMVLTEEEVTAAVETWSDITQVSDLSAAIRGTLVGSGA